MKKVMLGGLMFACVIQATGAVSYTTPDAIYFQDFNSLPNAPENISLGTTANGLGWTDDTVAPLAGQYSVLGWYLYHPTAVSEGGVNGHQRFRIGAGTQTTGAFWCFGSSGGTDRALGSLGANTIAPDSPGSPDGGNLYIALRLHNDTGVTLDSFTVSYYAEQWHGSGTATPETVLFGWSTTATAVNDPSTSFHFVPLLGWTAPVTLAAEGAVDGNANRFLVGPVTVTGINWAPDTDLWLRWTDLQIPSVRDDGMALDDFSFAAAVPEPSSVVFMLVGAGGFLLVRRRRI